MKVSSDPKMIGRIFKNEVDPMCLVCHQYSPVKRKNTTIVEEKNGVEFLRNMTLIYNRPTCYNCHRAEGKINGILVMDLSMTEIQTQLASNRNKLLLDVQVFG
ncbi:MAG: hypothetical protein QF466_05110 [Desulfobacterales bacterium]|nr:hypothetical protein [Desulfobacterales bacterium]